MEGTESATYGTGALGGKGGTGEGCNKRKGRARLKLDKLRCNTVRPSLRGKGWMSTGEQIGDHGR